MPRTMLLGRPHPLAQPSHSLLAPAKEMNKCRGQGAPQEHGAPWGSAQSLRGALGWVEKKTEGETISQSCNCSQEVLK